MKNPEAVVKACFDAYVRKDRAAVELLINDEFYFTSPLDNRIDRKTYFERCWPNSEHCAEFEFVNVVSHEDKVFVTYEAKSTNGEAFRNTEIFTVREEKIIEVEVYFGWSIPHKAPVNNFLTE
ncbi:MAG: ketosteroid isomerase [Cellvibrio sp. 79]|nr:MAG: ketosteroid isomerase [Cellvibrio sp. 79]